MVIGEVGHEEVATGPVEHRDDRGSVERPDDQVAFEVTDFDSFAGYRWAQPDQVELTQRVTLHNRLGVAAVPVFATAPFPLQVDMQAFGQCPSSLRVDLLVERLVRYPTVEVGVEATTSTFRQLIGVGRVGSSRWWMR